MTDFKFVQRYASKGEGKHVRIRTVTQKDSDMCSITLYEPALQILGTKPGGRAGVLYDNDERKVGIIRYNGDYSYKIHPYIPNSNKKQGFIQFNLPKPNLDIPVYQRSFIYNSRDIEIVEDLVEGTGKAIVVKLPDPKTIKT